MVNCGLENVKYVVVMLVGYFLLVYFLECYNVEDGCYFLFGEYIVIFIEVLLDGSIRNVEIFFNGVFVFIGKIVVVIEIKCLFLLENKMFVYYLFFLYYVC